MASIKLNFINNSQDTNNSSVVIFQKNAAEKFDEMIIAWKVIQNCGRGDRHPFVYDSNFEVSASDSYGNYTPQFPAVAGQAFEMILSSSGDILQISPTPATNPTEVEVRNNLRAGVIQANCHKGGLLLAVDKGLAPQQKAVFKFEPTIYIGVVSQIEEGGIINPAILSQINTEISLFGILKADIVMTGGGVGETAKPFSFSLENISK